MATIRSEQGDMEARRNPQEFRYGWCVLGGSGFVYKMINPDSINNVLPGLLNMLALFAV